MAIHEDSTINATSGARSGNGVVGSTTILDYNHSLYLHPSDGTGSMSMGLILIVMENYSLWSRAMKVALLGKNKLCLVDGTIPKEDFGAELGSQWDRYNAIVTSWLMSNVNRELVT